MTENRVTSLLELRIDPADVAGGYALLHEILAGTRAFDGNLGVEVLADETDPAHVMVVESWTSIEADDAYRAWRATPDGASDLARILTAPPVLVRYVGVPAA
jgi:quinol monooxygenase YgiN